MLAQSLLNAEGIESTGPMWYWKGRRAVHRRKDRRWSNSLESRNRSPTGSGSTYPEDPAMRISHEAIYQSLYVQGRGALRRELTACLRSGRALRLPRERARCRGKAIHLQTP